MRVALVFVFLLFIGLGSNAYVDAIQWGMHVHDVFE